MAVARVVRERLVIRAKDVRESEYYRRGYPLALLSADQAGIRSILMVPMVKEDAGLGLFAIYGPSAPSQPHQFAVSIALRVGGRPVAFKGRTSWKNVIICDRPDRQGNCSHRELRSAGSYRYGECAAAR